MVVTLNVGGTQFQTMKRTLLSPEASDSIFVPLLSKKFLQTKTIFFDRNPVAFAFILDYLRTGIVGSTPSLLTTESLFTEANYYALSNLANTLQDRLVSEEEERNKLLLVFEIGKVVTLDADQDAVVTNVGKGKTIVLDFGIPRGLQGRTGYPGPPGPRGPPCLSSNVASSSTTSNKKTRRSPTTRRARSRSR